MNIDVIMEGSMGFYFFDDLLENNAAVTDAGEQDADADIDAEWEGLMREWDELKKENERIESLFSEGG
jgi:hypothetical protein